MIGFLLANKWLLGAGAAIGVVTLIYLSGMDRGSERIMNRVERQDNQAASAGDQGWLDSGMCQDRGREWDVHEGRCL